MAKDAIIGVCRGSLYPGFLFWAPDPPPQEPRDFSP